jgi:hypothetical protein
LRERRSPQIVHSQSGGCTVEYVAYLRAEAARFRKRAKRADRPDAAKEFTELAAVCERVANDVEDRLPAG